MKFANKYTLNIILAISGLYSGVLGVNVYENNNLLTIDKLLLELVESKNYKAVKKVLEQDEEDVVAQQIGVCFESNTCSDEFISRDGMIAALYKAITVNDIRLYHLLVQHGISYKQLPKKISKIRQITSSAVQHLAKALEEEGELEALKYFQDI